MPFQNRLRLIAAAALCAAASAQSVLHVPAAFPDLQSALGAAAASGDEIRVAPGTYVGPGNRDVTTGGKAVLIVGVGGSGVVVFDCQASQADPHRGLIVVGGTGLVVRGITIRNAREADGAGATFVGGATATLDDVRFESCVADGRGGGAFVDGAGTAVTCVDCAFIDSAAQLGGGVAVLSGASATFVGCAFDGNDGAYGAGARVDVAAASFVDCAFTNNVAAQQGGGLHIEGGAPPLSSTVVLDGSSFTGNSADGGGALFSTGSTALIATDVSITNNSATYSGGGLQLEFRTVAQVFGGVVSGNSATIGSGAGLALIGDATLTASDWTISGNMSASSAGGAFVATNAGFPPACTLIGGAVSNNVAAGQGAGFFVSGGGAVLTCVDVAVAGNSSTNDGGGGGRLDAGARGDFLRCTLTNNAAAGSAGLTIATGATAALRECDVVDNASTLGAGGVLAIDSSTTTPTLSVARCTFRGNSAAQDGGALAAYGGATVDIEGSLFYGNSAAGCGPALHLADAAHALRNSTLADNTAGCAHSAAFVSGTATLLATNCVLRGATSPALEVAAPATATLAYCDVFGGAAGVGNFDADPLFVAPQSGDYRLTAASPCRNAAAAGLLGSGVVVDRLGAPRIAESVPDIGAFEHHPVRPGSGDGLLLTTTVAGLGGATPTKTAAVGALMSVALTSPTGAFVGSLPLLVANLFPMNAAPPSPTILPYVHIDPMTLLVLFDGAAPAPFFTIALPPGGLSFGYLVPPGLGGFALRLQGVALSPSAANGIFATTDAHEIHFL